MADSKISALTAATVMAGSDEIEKNEAGTSKKFSIDLLEGYLFTACSYAPGSFTLITGNYVNMAKQLILTGSQRGTLQGNSQLRIN